MQCVVLPHITASVFINDDEGGLHADYEKRLERLAPHAPVSQYQHNRTDEDACPEWTGCRRAPEAGRTIRRHFGSKKRLHSADHGPRRAAVVAVTGGRLDFGTWERIFSGQAGWLALES